MPAETNGAETNGDNVRRISHAGVKDRRGSARRRTGVGGSRLKSEIQRHFEAYLEVGLHYQNGDLTPHVIRKYPADYSNVDVLKSVPSFAFPCTKVKNEVLDQGSSVAVQHYTFVKTEEDSTLLFGFCRQAPSSVPVTACIVTFLPWHNAFNKLLDVLAEIGHQNGDIFTMLCQIYTHPVLLPNEIQHFNIGMETFSMVAPDLRNRLPTVPGDANMTQYYSLEPQHMISVFAAMLHERRILFVCKSLRKLTACIFAAESLIYPLYWQHIFIPVLPESLVDYSSAPMPYLIGIQHELFEGKVKTCSSMLGDAVVINLDKNEIHSEYNDVESLPNTVLADLKKKLKNPYAGGDVIPRAFLQALVALIGGYREALTFLPSQKIQFDENAFLASRPTQMKDFLESLLQLQVFQQFIDGRLAYLNQGLGFCDETDIFEKECSAFKIGQKAGDHYQDWLRENGKRLGQRLKSAGKGVKRAGEKGGKKIRGKMKEIHTSVRGGFDDHVLIEKFRHSAKEIRDNRTGGSSGSGSLEKTSLGSDGLLHHSSAPNSPILRPPRPATSYVSTRTAEAGFALHGSSEDDLRPKSLLEERQARRVTAESITSGTTGLVPRKYHVIADFEEEDDEDEDEDESYDEAEEDFDRDQRRQPYQSKGKVPPPRPPLPSMSSESLPRVSLDLFADPDILGLIDTSTCSTNSLVDVSGPSIPPKQGVQATPPILGIPAPVPPPRRKRTGSGIHLPEIDDLIPGRPGEPPVVVNTDPELMTFGVHETALAAASLALDHVTAADFDPLNPKANIAHPQIKNFKNPLYDANGLSSLTQFSNSTATVNTVSVNRLGTTTFTNSSQSFVKDNRASTETSNQRHSANNNSLFAQPTPTPSYWVNQAASVGNTASTLKREDQQLLEEWSLLSLNSSHPFSSGPTNPSSSNASNPLDKTIPEGDNFKPIPTMRAKQNPQKKTATQDPFADLVPF